MKYLLMVPAGLVLVCVLVGYNARRQQFPRAAWGWLGMYGLLTVFQIAGEAYRNIDLQGLGWPGALQSTGTLQFLIQMPFWYAYDSLAFLVLVFIGNFFARKHGGLSFLVLLGYLLPTVIFGRYGMWNESLPFILVSLAVLLYRFVVALAAPLWLVRTASTPGRRRAIAIPVAVTILGQITLSMIDLLANAYIYGPTPLDFAMSIWSQLILAAGLGLAVVLYLPGAKSQDPTATPAPTLTAATE